MLALRIKRRNTVSVTPAMGANTVAGATGTPPITTDAGTRAEAGMLFSRGLSQLFFMDTFFIKMPTRKRPPRTEASVPDERVYLAAGALAASDLPASDLAYLRRNRSTRPAVSTSF